MFVWYQPADTAGSAANFTPSAGSNYENVDDIGSDDDATYNYSTTSTTKDQIAHSYSLDVDPLVVQPLAMGRYESTAESLKVGILSNTTEDLDTAKALGATYSGVRGKLYVTDPDTASAWSASGADAAETVYEHA
jgi:hypothetical protein